MGLFRLVKTLVNDEAMGDEIVGMQETMYAKARQKNPNGDPHQFLSTMWLSRMAARGANTSDEQVQNSSFVETLQSACVPPPYNARALGLFFLGKERMDIAEKYTKYGIEISALMTPVYEAFERGNGLELYARHNPRLGSDRNFLRLLEGVGVRWRM